MGNTRVGNPFIGLGGTDKSEVDANPFIGLGGTDKSEVDANPFIGLGGTDKSEVDGPSVSPTTEGRARSGTIYADVDTPPITSTIGTQGGAPFSPYLENNSSTGTQGGDLFSPYLENNSSTTDATSGKGRARSGTIYTDVDGPPIATTTSDGLEGQPVSEQDDEDEFADELQSDERKRFHRKLARWVERARRLAGARKHLEAGVQFTRAYAIAEKQLNRHPAAALCAGAAANCFAMGGDYLRAISWYRHSLKADGQSPFRDQAQTFLAQAEASAEPKYALTTQVLNLYQSVSKHSETFQKASLSADDIRRAKATGLAQEELVSMTALEKLDQIIGLLDVANQTLNAGNLDLQRFVELQARNLYLIRSIENMATGEDPNRLLAQRRAEQQWAKDQQGPKPNTDALDRLRAFRVRYLKTSVDRAEHQLSYDAASQRIVQGNANTPFDTSALSTNYAGSGFAIFTMTEDGEIFAAQHKVSQFHHSSLVAGEAAAAGGELQVRGGKLTRITNKSGHYWTTAAQLCQVIDELEGWVGADALADVQLYFHAPDSQATAWPGGAAQFRSDVGRWTVAFAQRTLMSIQACLLYKDQDWQEAQRRWRSSGGADAQRPGPDPAHADRGRPAGPP
ncbi:MAG: hypothetical protein HGA45_28150 [Chloroflexales bacterium]|nr:hypothetical protein [Chloroflexales bacterium]